MAARSPTPTSSVGGPWLMSRRKPRIVSSSGSGSVATSASNSGAYGEWAARSAVRITSMPSRFERSSASAVPVSSKAANSKTTGR